MFRPCSDWRLEVTKLDAPIEAPTAAWTFARYLEWWLAEEVCELKPATRRSYRRAVDNYVAAIGDVPLGEITRAQLQAVMDNSVASGRYAPSTARFEHRSIASAIRLAIADRLIDHNPVRRVREPHIEAKLLELPTTAELLAFLRVALAPRGVGGAEWYGPLIAAALMTGMRRGELCGLRWPNVRLEDLDTGERDDGIFAAPRVPDIAERLAGGAIGEIHIVEQADYLNGERYEWLPPKSARGTRRVPITADLAAILRAQRERSSRQRLRTGTRRWKELDLVFPSQRGTPANGATLGLARAKIAKAAGLAVTPTFHILRHAWVSMLVEADVPLPTIVRLAGHADGQLISRTYYGLMGKGLDRAARAIAVGTTDRDQPLDTPKRI